MSVGRNAYIDVQNGEVVFDWNKDKGYKIIFYEKESLKSIWNMYLFTAESTAVKIMHEICKHAEDGYELANNIKKVMDRLSDKSRKAITLERYVTD